MKTCKKCSKQFKSFIVIDGKHHSLTGRSYCLECSPLFEKKGYSIRKDKTRKHLNDSGKICPVCEKQQSKYWKNDVCSTCRSSFIRHKRKIELKTCAGGKCEKCGNDNINILQFHHLNPDDKKFNISRFYHSKNIDSLKDEISKCILLCPNCHALEHIKNIQYIIDYYQFECGILDSNQ